MYCNHYVTYLKINICLQINVRLPQRKALTSVWATLHS